MDKTIKKWMLVNNKLIMPCCEQSMNLNSVVTSMSINKKLPT